jgi:hypothetical protein
LFLEVLRSIISFLFGKVPKHAGKQRHETSSPKKKYTRMVNSPVPSTLASHWKIISMVISKQELNIKNYPV